MSTGPMLRAVHSLLHAQKTFESVRELNCEHLCVPALKSADLVRPGDKGIHTHTVHTHNTHAQFAAHGVDEFR